MEITGTKIAILVDNYFEQAEFEEPLSMLKDAGVDVTVIAADSKELQGLHHVDLGDRFTADLLLRDASADDYDALVLPGGAINADHLRMNDEAQAWARDYLDAGKPVAAICHAPWLLVSAEVVDGRKLTSYATIQDDIRNAGGEWTDREVVVDGSLITSRGPDDIPAFTQAIIKMLSRPADPDEPEEAEDVADIDAAVVADNGENPPPATDESARERDARLRALGYDRRRDRLTDQDEMDLTGDQDVTDPDELRPHTAVPADERDGS